MCKGVPRGVRVSRTGGSGATLMMLRPRVKAASPAHAPEEHERGCKGAAGDSWATDPSAREPKQSQALLRRTRCQLDTLRGRGSRPGREDDLVPAQGSDVHACQRRVEKSTSHAARVSSPLLNRIDFVARRNLKPDSRYHLARLLREVCGFLLQHKLWRRSVTSLERREDGLHSGCLRPRGVHGRGRVRRWSRRSTARRRSRVRGGGIVRRIPTPRGRRHQISRRLRGSWSKP